MICVFECHVSFDSENWRLSYVECKTFQRLLGRAIRFDKWFLMLDEEEDSEAALMEEE